MNRTVINEINFSPCKLKYIEVYDWDLEDIMRNKLFIYQQIDEPVSADSDFSLFRIAMDE